jgi:hypothetical protein
MPSTSFTSREQGLAVGSSTAKGHLPPPAANPGGVTVSLPPASESGRLAESSSLSLLQSSELPGPSSQYATTTSGIPPSAAPQSSSASPSGPAAASVSEPGGPQKRELDPPGAAAAEAIAGGIAEIFGPVTREADQQVEAALRSQEKLALSIDRLTRGQVKDWRRVICLSCTVSFEAMRESWANSMKVAYGRSMGFVSHEVCVRRIRSFGSECLGRCPQSLAMRIVKSAKVKVKVALAQATHPDGTTSKARDS